MAKSKKNIVILKYPDVVETPPKRTRKSAYITQELFERHLLWLLDWGYSPTSPDELKQFVHEQIRLPAKSFMLLFEDGHKSFKNLVYPVLKRYKIPALAFLVVNHIGDYQRWDDSMKEMLTIDDIAELNKTSMITFGSQTKSHRDLTKLSEEELEDEIIRANYILEEILGYPVEYFNYPYDKYNDNVLMTLMRANISIAFINKKAQILDCEGLHKLPSVKVNQKHGYFNFIRLLRSLEA